MEDTRWARRAWDDPVPTGIYAAQPGSPEDRRTADALEAVREPREVVQLHRAPGLNDPRPQRDLGLAWSGTRRAVGVRDVLAQSRPRTESHDFSGSPAGFTGSVHDSQGTAFG